MKPLFSHCKLHSGLKYYLKFVTFCLLCGPKNCEKRECCQKDESGEQGVVGDNPPAVGSRLGEYVSQDDVLEEINKFLSLWRYENEFL